MIRAARITAVVGAVVAAAAAVSAGPLPPPGHEAAVIVHSYDGQLMEPFVTRDGRYLLFNNANHPPDRTDLHLARAIDATEFRYLGRLDGANTAALDAVASVDDVGTIFWTSTHRYGATSAVIHRGRFAEGGVTGAALVPGLARGPGWVQFDAEISADGQTLYLSEGWFATGQVDRADLIVAHRSGPGADAGFVARRPAAIFDRVNTAAQEYAPALSADEKTIVFTRWEQGRPPRLWRADRGARGQPFGPPDPLPVPGFVEAASFAAGDRHIYFHRNTGGRLRLFVYGLRPGR